MTFDSTNTRFLIYTTNSNHKGNFTLKVEGEITDSDSTTHIVFFTWPIEIVKHCNDMI